MRSWCCGISADAIAPAASLTLPFLACTRFATGSSPGLRCSTSIRSPPPNSWPRPTQTRSSTIELAAQAVHVAENPCLGQAAIPGREECCSVVGHEDAGGWDAEDLTAVVARVTQPGGGAVALGDQVEDLVAEIGERGADLVAVAAELVLAGGFVAQRAPEDEALVEQVGDGRVIPQVPYVRVEALNQISHLASLPVSRNPRLLLSRPACTGLAIFTLGCLVQDAGRCDGGQVGADGVAAAGISRSPRGGARPN